MPNNKYPLSMDSESYPDGFRLLSLYAFTRPREWKSWRNLLWGFDIWLGPVPFFKTVVFANICAWIVLYLSRQGV